MSASSANPEYHSITFESIAEAAAFIAALSRVLNSPRSSLNTGPVEIWFSFSAPRVLVYLSDAAKNAAARAFAPLPPTRACNRADFAPATRLILDSDHLPAWGSQEAERAILAS